MVTISNVALAVKDFRFTSKTVNKERWVTMQQGENSAILSPNILGVPQTCPFLTKRSPVLCRQRLVCWVRRPRYNRRSKIALPLWQYLQQRNAASWTEADCWRNTSRRWEQSKIIMLRLQLKLSIAFTTISWRFNNIQLNLAAAKNQWPTLSSLSLQTHQNDYLESKTIPYIAGPLLGSFFVCRSSRRTLLQGSPIYRQGF